MLSGGGARGLAHVGVLKVLERERIPVDFVAGTSMGAIIGGLYASGSTAQALEQELLPLSWERLFASRVDRQHLSQRRKEEDFEFSAAIELGMRDGEVRLPDSTLSSRGLEALLRRHTLSVRHQQNFDHLPIPFRAIATDLETGEQRVLAKGDLAMALRSSMSVPGVFSPVELEGRILGDGGLVNNLPIDVARQMGANHIIAVNVGTPLAARSTLTSVLGVTAQMINILTEQNVRRSLESLGAQDVLIAPELGPLSATDFNSAREFIEQGERAASALIEKLRPLALSPKAYAAWRAQRLARGANEAAPRIAALAFEGSALTRPEQWEPRLHSQPGKVFNSADAERDARLLASSGDYERVDYHVESRTAGDTLVFLTEDKSWGPNYFRMGLDLSTDFSGESSFNLRISHNRHWLTNSGTEWRNQISLGRTPKLFSELYQPLGGHSNTSTGWFASGWSEIERRQIKLYDRDTGSGLGSVSRTSGSAGLDLGQPWGQWGEVRLGVVTQLWRFTPELLIFPSDQNAYFKTWHEVSLRLKAVVDQLDYVSFPQNGYRLSFEAARGRVRGPDQTQAQARRVELVATSAKSWGAHTLTGHMRLFDSQESKETTLGPYSLGGFQQLSGYQPGQLLGERLAFARLGYHRRLLEAPLLTRGLFVGGSLEVGNAWDPGKSNHKGAHWASSIFIGADTGLGPLYLALGYAPKGGSAVYLFIGRP
ncbi:patatin-like phospholipase family protein [Roseateles sp. BYS180W]|uniref:Patatin-like phospholipase family protein n=1 Tax=Roseateles rivi TaxID=3299028 RepID=A0ABW7FRX5_9BURK